MSTEGGRLPWKPGAWGAQSGVRLRWERGDARDTAENPTSGASPSLGPVGTGCEMCVTLAAAWPPRPATGMGLARYMGGHPRISAAVGPGGLPAARTPVLLSRGRRLSRPSGWSSETERRGPLPLHFATTDRGRLVLRPSSLSRCWTWCEHRRSATEGAGPLRRGGFQGRLPCHLWLGVCGAWGSPCTDLGHCTQG